MLDLDAFCRRIGYSGPIGADLVTLSGLQRAFVLSVPFENIDIRIGRPLRLEVGWLFEKIVSERRGGFCFELNGLFGAVLEQLGFGVTRLGVSLRNRETGSWTSPFAHLALRVELDEPFLVDVGLDDPARAPLRIQDEGEQSDGWARYRISREEEGSWLLALGEPGAPLEARYRFDGQERRLEDFAQTCERLQTSLDSPFLRDYLCCQARAEGRVMVTGQRVVEVDRAGRREKTLFDRDAFVEALREHLGLDLPAILLALPDCA